MNDLLLVVEIKHVNWGHLGWGAAGPRGAARVGMLHQVGVRILLHEHVLTLAGAVVGFITLGGNDPIPAERLEVHGQRVAAAARFGGVLVAVQPEVPPRTLGGLKDLHLQERLLESGGGRQGGHNRQNNGYKRTTTQ